MFHVTLCFVGGGHITCRNTELICCRDGKDLAGAVPAEHQVVVNVANVAYMRLATDAEKASVECRRSDRVDSQ